MSLFSHCADASALAEAIAQRCEDAHPYQDGWRARCPNHQGKSDTSLSITPADDRVLLTCFGTCETKDVVHVLGLTMADLFVRGSAPTNGHKRIVQVYDYYDAHGTLVHQTVRYIPKDFKQRRPDPAKPGEYIWRLTGIEPVLYHLPQVLDALQRGVVIYFVEGEKDADALQALGLVATTNPMGAGKWRKSYTEVLRGAHVVLLPDHDEPGLRHVQRVANALEGTAADMKIVPGLHTNTPGSDISDWLTAGGTQADLEAAVEHMPWYTVPAKETPQGPPQQPAGTDPAADLGTVSPCTHVANATRIARAYIERLRYVLGRGWILWTGQYWRTDPTAEGALATGFVSGLARAIAREAATLMEHAAQEGDSDRRAALMKLAETRLKWAVQSENERVIAAGLKLAKPALLIEHGAIDRNPWLFNCQNGTVNLRTGDVQAHNPEDLITHMSPATVDPTATCPTWERFLFEVFAGDSDMVGFMQRALGWSLTGVVQERALFFLYGPKGHNGKTTLVETVRDLLGDCGEASFGYARKVDVSTFMKSKNQDDNQRKAAMLAGPRFVYSSEVDAEHRLNEQLIKDITGGDTLEGRYLYREAFTFKPTFKPWMYGNHKPEIRGTDDALWSRVKLVPFEVSFEDRRDLELPDKLRAELSGILNWAIQGCLAWQREGLNPPEKVKAATQQYRLEQDPIAQFIHTCCVVLPQASIKAKRLYVAYLTWCGENGHEARSQHRFGAYLTAHDYPSDDNASGHGAIRRGIDLQDPPEEDDEPATLSREDTEKGSRQQSQQPRGEIGKAAQNATLATLETGKSPTNEVSWGFPESKGSKGSNQGRESRESGVNTSDEPATLSSAKGSTRCPRGGNHVWLKRSAGRLCSRCNTEES